MECEEILRLEDIVIDPETLKERLRGLRDAAGKSANVLLGTKKQCVSLMRNGIRCYFHARSAFPMLESELSPRTGSQTIALPNSDISGKCPSTNRGPDVWICFTAWVLRMHYNARADVQRSQETLHHRSRKCPRLRGRYDVLRAAGEEVTERVKFLCTRL